MTRSALSHERRPGAGIQLHVARAGEGRPIVLLHGFPENWSTWIHQVDPLADAGFSVWIPDLRGYGSSDRPTERSAYRMQHLVEDIASLIRSIGPKPAVLVGHDWGGLIAWALAARHPELLDKLVILNAPHPRLYRRRLTTSLQALRSWYILPAQVPVVAEAILAAGDFWIIRRMFRIMPARPNTFPPERIDDFIRDLKRPGALTAALEYYRANLRGGGRGGASSGKIQVPTLVLWGERDPALGTNLLDGLDALVQDLRVVRFPDVGHWIQNEAPGEVNRELLAYLSSADRAGG